MINKMADLIEMKSALVNTTVGSIESAGKSGRGTLGVIAHHEDNSFNK